MPGIVPLGKLFFLIFFREVPRPKPTYRKARAVVSPRLERVPSWATNRREDNPAQIEAEERTSHRADWERGDACAERVDSGPNQAQ